MCNIGHLERCLAFNDKEQHKTLLLLFNINFSTTETLIKTLAGETAGDGNLIYIIHFFICKTTIVNMNKLIFF